jgi:hypothetical protein
MFASAPAVARGLPPKVERSGATPWASMPQKCSPVRPHPVWTSSATNKIPYSSSTSFIAP